MTEVRRKGRSKTKEIIKERKREKEVVIRRIKIKRRRKERTRADERKN